MRTNENYLPHTAIAAVLTVAVLVLFQVYLLREPARIAADQDYHKNADVKAGETLFAKNCATCHGEKGEGSDDGPSLNNKQFLSTTDDGTIFSVASSGVPNTQMPAWNQVHGGPLTDEDVRQVVTFIRAWQPTAPDVSTTVRPGDASRGQAIFDSTCYACHGKDGKGTARAPALNDPAHLSQFDDAWYKDTIMKGRPAQGMPTWGTVLNPAQVNDLLALLDSWRTAAPSAAADAKQPTATPAVQPTLAPTPTTAPATATAAPTTSAAVTATEVATATVEVARPSNEGGPGPALDLKGNTTAGMRVYDSNCTKCHGPQGKGGVDNAGSTDGTIPPLNPIDDTLKSDDAKVYAYNIDLFMEHGSTPDGKPKEVMPAWGDTKKLTPQQIADVIAYVISLNK